MVIFDGSRIFRTGMEIIARLFAYSYIPCVTALITIAGAAENMHLAGLIRTDMEASEISIAGIGTDPCATVIAGLITGPYAVTGIFTHRNLSRTELMIANLIAGL